MAHWRGEVLAQKQVKAQPINHEIRQEILSEGRIERYAGEQNGEKPLLEDPEKKSLPGGRVNEIWLVVNAHPP